MTQSKYAVEEFTACEMAAFGYAEDRRILMQRLRPAHFQHAKGLWEWLLILVEPNQSDRERVAVLASHLQWLAPLFAADTATIWPPASDLADRIESRYEVMRHSQRLRDLAQEADTGAFIASKEAVDELLADLWALNAARTNGNGGHLA